MVKKLKVWLNNTLNKRLHCTVVIKFQRIFVIELVFTFFVFKYQSHFEFPKGGKPSARLKILEIPWGRGVIKDPLEWKILGGWGVCKSKSLPLGGMDIFWNHIIPVITLCRTNTICNNFSTVLYLIQHGTKFILILHCDCIIWYTNKINFVLYQQQQTISQLSPSLVKKWVSQRYSNNIIFVLKCQCKRVLPLPVNFVQYQYQFVLYQYQQTIITTSACMLKRYYFDKCKSHN